MTEILNKYNRVSLAKAIDACFLAACILLISSCKNDLPFNQDNEKKLVVMAELTAGESAYIPVASSLVAGNGQPIHFEKLTDASVIIIAQDGTESKLRFNNSADFKDNPATIYTHPGIFKPNVDYHLEITHPRLGAVSAYTHIPASFVVNEVEKDESELYGKDALKFSFKIKDNGDERNYYIFEVVKELAHASRYFYWQGVRYDYNTKAGEDLHEDLEDDFDIDIPIVKDTTFSNKNIRLNVNTSDPKTDNNNIGPLDSSFNRIFITDSLFNGQSYSTSFLISMDHFKARNPEDKGIVKVQIKSVDKDLYTYLLQYEKYKTDFGKMPVGQLGSPAGNIKNGLGIFGGSFKKEWRYYYDDLE